MKVVILAGGFGTRISEESHLKPKPMIDIGDKPILWHIMKIYEHYGFNDFIICAGYKSEIIKKYFYDYFLINSDLSIDLSNNNIVIHNNCKEKFKVTIVDTGLNTKTSGRIQQIESYIDTDNFFLTYGDGLSDININKLKEFHLKHNKIATLTAIQPEGRFGVINFEEDGLVQNFKEKPIGDGGWINGGFFVFNKKIFNYFKPDAENIMLEAQPLVDITNDNELMAYKHYGFWKAMDALRDKSELEEIWKNDPKWKIW
jgi:glucose-1-phosphate cytidylyltransferase